MESVYTKEMVKVYHSADEQVPFFAERQEIYDGKCCPINAWFVAKKEGTQNVYVSASYFMHNKTEDSAMQLVLTSGFKCGLEMCDVVYSQPV